MTLPDNHSERPDVTVTLPYWVASALFKAAAVGIEAAASSDEEAERMWAGTLTLGRAMQASRESYPAPLPRS